MNETQREAIAHLTSDGFVWLRTFCDAGLVASLFDIARQRAAVVRAALGSRPIGIGSAAGYIEIVQRSPGRWDVPITPRQFGIADKEMPWWPLITALLGSDAQHSFSGVVSADPGSPAQYWHTDSPHLAPEHRPAHAINVMLALHDVELAMGPTECARASHRLSNHLSNTAIVSDELIYQHAGTTPESLVSGTGQSPPECWSHAMTAGDCLVFDDRLLHRGLANQTDRPRHVAYFSYRRKDYRVNTHFETQQSVFDSPQ